MKFFYGCVDRQSNAWGFLEETDPRVTQDMIELSTAEWQNLLNEQSQGKDIVCFEGKVFATGERGRYYVDTNTGEWTKKDDTAFNAEKLEQAKGAKISENEKKRQVEYINTPIGKLKTDTPLGDLKTALPLYDKLANASNGLPENAVRLYVDGEIKGSPAMSLDEYNKLSIMVAMEYMKIDTYSTQITAQILQAETIAELEEITIDYDNLPTVEMKL